MGEDQALLRLREILSRPEFTVDQSPSWWQQLLAPVFYLIDYLLGLLFNTVVETTTGREGWFGIVVLALSAALIEVAPSPSQSW